MNYYSCPMIEGCHFNINGRIDTGEDVVALCCESVEGRPGVAFADTPESTLKNFIGQRALVIAESKKKEYCGTVTDRFISGCQKCANYQKKEWGSDGLIHYVNLSMYPAPCQCRCCYCSVWEKDQSIKSEAAQKAYEHLFDMLELGRNSGIIAPNSTWQVSSGEIAIHPYRERIMDLVQNERAVFYTNCFKFDERIAENLHNNPNSAINLSIDAGLPQTWRKIKGFNNFGTVTSNLVKYYAASARPGQQITLKYIVLPGINDTYEDYLSLIEIMKVLEVKHLTISRDTRIKYSADQGEREKIIGAAAYLLAMCHKNGITNDMFTYAPEERAATLEFAKELIRTGRV